MSKNISLAGLILAAGRGKRMNSSLPKVLHEIAGRPMLAHVVATLRATPLTHLCAVLSPELSPFADFMAEYPDVAVCVQELANGTGGAVAACAPGLLGVQACGYAPGRLVVGRPVAASHVLICAGDCPGLKPSELTDFIDDALRARAPLAVLGMEVDEPHGYGRLVRAPGGDLVKIAEERDASPAERAIRLCNSGVIFAETAHLFSLLARLLPQNAQAEYYLTDVVELSWREGKPARAYVTKEWRSFLGVNTPEQLRALEEYMTRSSHL